MAGAVAVTFVLLAPALSWGMTAEAATDRVLVGSNLSSASKLKSLGASPDLAKFWVGIWTKKDWTDVDDALNKAKSLGVTPVIQWYYWGDDISPDCVENGCYSSLHGGWKKKSDWNAMAVTLAKKVRAIMGDRPAYVILETEFNKQGIATYEPFDGYLVSQADVFRTYAPNAKLILGFGNWGWSNYKNFDRAIAKTDYLGTQSLQGSTRDSDSTYLNAVNRLIEVSAYLKKNFGKPVFITDTGFSSYPEPKYAGYQERMIKEMFARIGDLKANGVHAWMYRSVFDNPKMNTANYYGYAERYWGFLRSDGSWKPAMNDYVNGIKAVKAGSTSSGGSTGSTSITVQAESFDWKSVGGSQYDSRAANDRAWNLWSNGYVKESVTVSSSGVYNLTVKARGSYAGGNWPLMVMTVDGAEVGRWKVTTSDAYWSYTGKASFEAGKARVVRVHFMNDYRDSNGDRNLYLDLMRVGVASSAVKTVASREAEDFRYRPVGGRMTDERASKGAAWNVWSNGAIRDTVKADKSARHDLTVYAKGTKAAGVGPTMVVFVDGAEVGRFAVTTDGSYAPYTVNRYLSAGDHGVRVAFVNDHRTSTEDRNLHVDRVTWAPAN